MRYLQILSSSDHPFDMVPEKPMSEFDTLKFLSCDFLSRHQLPVIQSSKHLGSQASFWFPKFEKSFFKKFSQMTIIKL